MSATIRNKALKRMGLVSVGQTASSEMTADLDAAYSEVYAELSALDLVTWNSGDTVPLEFVHSVVSLTAYHRIDEYSISNDRYSRVVADASGAIPRIRELQGDDVVDTVPSVYF